MFDSRIEQGNSFKLLNDIPSQSVEAIITDPPYDFNKTQIKQLHSEFCRITKGTIIVFSPPENQWKAKDVTSDQICFWAKPISTKNTSRRYSRFVEMIFIFTEFNEVSGKWNCKRHWSQYTNIFTDLVEGETKSHPFTKPFSLVRRLIENHTDENDIILDPFCGSGTIPMVSKFLNRNYIGFELDQTHYELSLKRMQEV